MITNLKKKFITYIYDITKRINKVLNILNLKNNLYYIIIYGYMQDLKLKAKRYTGILMDNKPFAVGDRKYFIRDENLMKIAKLHIGIPVIIKHKIDLNSDNVDSVRIGMLSNVFLNNQGFIDEYNQSIPADNYIWYDMLIDDEQAINLLQQGWRTSNAYNPILTGPMEHNGIQYDGEVIGATMADHLAIVNDPKYNDIKVFANSRDNLDIKKTQPIISQCINNIDMSTLKDFKNKLFLKTSFIMNENKEKVEEVEEKKDNILKIEDCHFFNDDGTEISGKDIVNAMQNKYCINNENKEKTEEEKKDVAEISNEKIGEVEVVTEEEKKDVVKNDNIQEIEEKKEEKIYGTDKDLYDVTMRVNLDGVNALRNLIEEINKDSKLDTKDQIKNQEPIEEDKLSFQNSKNVQNHGISKSIDAFFQNSIDKLDKNKQTKSNIDSFDISTKIKERALNNAKNFKK